MARRKARISLFFCLRWLGERLGEKSYSPLRLGERLGEGLGEKLGWWVRTYKPPDIARSWWVVLVMGLMMPR